ncbi:MAG: putative rane-bound mannosyltransferase [Chthoniobacter sp.]|nr:putative rane-bound mannosyltransferase [Chthoniobacter sp.]
MSSLKSGAVAAPALWLTRSGWISLAIVLLALALRVVALDIKPAHFDEGVNGWFVDQITRDGYYHYDPTNFHGPLHFYVLFVAQTLFGRSEWALRLPLALVSTGCVVLMLAFRRYFGERACQIAALAMAVSPGFVFYGRYAIHESWLVFFLLLTIWGLIGLCHEGSRRFLWATGLGLTGMVLTKETYIIHWIALALGYLTLRWLERLGWLSSATRFRAAPQRWDKRDLARVGGVGALLILFFYTGGFLDWPAPRTYGPEGLPNPQGSICGLYETFGAWLFTGVHADTGHGKDWWYWLELLSQYEWPALLGLLAALAIVRPGVGRHLRWVAISGGGTLCAYSIIHYKTPWCLIAMIPPFYFVFGAAVVHLSKRFDRWATGALAGILLLCSLGRSLALNFRDFASELEPYAYVQTVLDINKLLHPLRTIAAADPRNYHLTGYLVLADQHPLVWLLGDFTRAHFGLLTDLPEDLSDGKFLVVDEIFVEEIERSLKGSFFREQITIRGNSGATHMIYFERETFAALFPGRVPEFEGPVIPEEDAP